MQFHLAVMSQAGRRPRRKTKYRNIVPGLALLAALAMVMAGVTAVRLGFVAVEIKRGPRLSGGEPAAQRVEPAPVTAAKPAPAAAPRPRVREDARLTSARILAKAAVTPDTATPVSAETAVQVAASATTDPPARLPAAVTPVAAAVTALPSKALAASTGAAKRVAECATMVATAVNIDPTNGEISGSTGLPDQVSYFKAKGRKAQCRPLARPTASR